MRLRIALVIALAGCGGSGGLAPSSNYAGRCQNPRSGIDPGTGQAYPDQQGTTSDEKNWLRSWIDELYLWYREVPTNLNPSAYATPIDWFNALKTPLTTASGAPKDKFHFTYDTATWESLSQSGVEAGYGVAWVLIARSPPRQAVVGYVQSGSVAAQNNLARGAQVISVDGAAITNGDPATLNAGLFPSNAGESHTFVIQDPGASTTRSVTMVSAAVTETPLLTVSTPVTGVGYMLLNSFSVATEEKELIDGINQLKTAGVTDLVLDLRYNGGGYLDLASELAYMIAGPGPTAGKTFEKTVWNDKYPNYDPVAQQPLAPTPFFTQTLGFSPAVAAGQALPHLDLARLFVLTGSIDGGVTPTCSASESVINSLRGVNVQVVMVGSTTCGKPYGFYPQDNCGTTYFAIEFQGVNDKGFGDYSDGFVPAGSGTNGVPGCQVADDFNHALGDPAEARFAAAMQYRGNSTCPPATMQAFRAPPAAETASLQIGRPSRPWRENRIYRGR
jgi:hypothetical protein